MKFSRFLGIFLALAFTLICYLLAESGGAPAQAIGNPGLCFQSGCHISFPLRTDSSLLTVTGFPSTYTPGMSYPVTVTVRNNPTASASSARAGFAAFVNRDGTAFTSSVGTITTTDTAGTRLLPYDGGGTLRIAYVTHSLPRAGSPSASFAFQWTAPAAPGGNAVLVVGANSANGDGQNTGDVISKQTFTAAAGAACAYAIAPTAQSFPAAGGTSSINITTDSGCAWTAASNSSFITVTAGASGSGAGTVNYAVAANTGAGRTGTLTVAGQTFTVTQAAGDCAYSITPTSQAFAAAGGTATVSVTTTAGCAWTATSGNAFIAVASGSSGAGSGTVILSVAANAGSTLRTGTATIAGETFSVSQAGAQAENEKSNFAQFGNGDLGG
ncbi:MAG: BACON domain-containing protein, partial [Acidobacteria bacterium]|nr:BACON domain-containing protein [Acidobacteriota bacterium]